MKSISSQSDEKKAHVFFLVFSAAVDCNKNGINPKPFTFAGCVTQVSVSSGQVKMQFIHYLALFTVGCIGFTDDGSILSHGKYEKGIYLVHSIFFFKSQ